MTAARVRDEVLTLTGRKPRQERPMKKPATAKRVSAADSRRIEIALARGVSAHDVMAIWNLSYELLQTVRDGMSESA